MQWEERNCLLLEDYDEDGNDVLQAFALSENFLEKTQAMYGMARGSAFEKWSFRNMTVQKVRRRTIRIFLFCGRWNSDLWSGAVL